MRKNIFFTISCLVCVLSFTGCASTQLDWAKASKQNTISAYETFIIKHPDSEYIKQANDRIELLRQQKEKAQQESRALAKATLAHIKKITERWSELHYGMSCEQVDKIIGFVEYQRASFGPFGRNIATDCAQIADTGGHHKLDFEIYNIEFKSGELTSWQLKPEKLRLYKEIANSKERR